MEGRETETDRIRHALQILHYLSPIAVFAYYLLAATVSICTLQTLKVSGSGPRKPIICLMSLVLLSYVSEACMLVADTLTNHADFSSTDANVFALSNVLVWTMMVVSLVGTNNVVWHPHCGAWAIALFAEILLFAFGFGPSTPRAIFVYIDRMIQACRMLILAALPLTILSERLRPMKTTDEESASLLDHGKATPGDAQSPEGSSQYGSITNAPKDASLDYEAKRKKKDEEDRQRLEKGLQDSGNWFKYLRRFSIFIPLVFPSSRDLVPRIVGVTICIVLGRVLNLLEPRQLGIILDSLDVSRGHVPIFEFLLYLFFAWLSGSVLSPIRHMLWTSVDLKAQASLKTAAYSHIMDLSRDFHTAKQSGELYKSIEQGESIISLVEVVAFQIMPMFLDVSVAFWYGLFGPYMALTVAATTAAYLWCSNYLINMQTEPRRKTRGIIQKESQLMYDTVGAWSSVSYFNRQAYEKGRYAAAVDLTMLWQRKLQFLIWYAWSAQDIAIELGLVIAGILAIYQVANGSHKAGTFAFLMTYWGTFTGRLGSFAYSQSQIQHSLVDAESLLELFMKTPSVKDGADIFTFKNGSIDFHNVGFSYDGKTETIKNFNLRVAPGQRVALVGETGGGKSTILKLLFRFYDVQEGKIEIDGQDVTDVTLESLRQCVGVVPQDPGLFNQNVMENVRYARLEATDEEVMDACRGAAIHEKILTFSEGYLTMVGENGVKLSGGELQRIAIARVLLKNSDIVLLDEATSAIDTETEAHIQEALEKLTRGRTTITIAHRLSTVTNADVIVVIKGGQTVEQGSPHALLEAKGKFSELWLRQVGIGSLSKDEESKDGQMADQSPHEEKPTNRSDSPKPAKDRAATRSSEASSSGKSLRPTAPEFVPRKESVPRNQRGTAAAGTQTSPDQSTLGHQHVRLGLSAGANDGKRKPQQNRKTLDHRISEVVDSDSQWETTAIDQNEPRKKHFSPAQRRRKNQTDPSESTSTSIQDASSSDALTLKATSVDDRVHSQSRRVSAPGGPLSNTTNVGAVGSKQRRRGQRWYQKKRTTSALGSTTASGERSAAASSDTLHPGIPTVRLPPYAENSAGVKSSKATSHAPDSVHLPAGE